VKRKLASKLKNLFPPMSIKLLRGYVLVLLASLLPVCSGSQVEVNDRQRDRPALLSHRMKAATKKLQIQAVSLSACTSESIH
jgi:hypothetical protein